MKKWAKRNNKKVIDGIKFDSGEEVEVYSALKDGWMYDLTWIKELDKAKLVDARPESFILYPSFKAWDNTIRTRKYTHDFNIIIWKDKIALEVKSKWSEAKPDYRLRRAIFLYLFHDKVKFAELITMKKWEWVYRKYF